MPRSLAPQPNESASPSRLGPFRRATLGLTAVALVGTALAGCGNAAVKQREDTRPEPNASTEGARQVYPSAAPAGALPTASPLPGSANNQTSPRLDPPTNGSLPR